MRKVLFLCVFLTLCIPLYATEVPTKVSGQTVTFFTVANMITFDSVTKHIFMQNESKVNDVFVDLICRDSDGKRGFMSKGTTTIKLWADGSQTPNSVELDFATINIGFISDVGNSNDKVTYWVTGDVGDF